jgi:hypothetical protein
MFVNYTNLTALLVQSQTFVPKEWKNLYTNGSSANVILPLIINSIQALKPVQLSVDSYFEIIPAKIKKNWMKLS